ncbi:solute carrier family 22 member 15-like [Tubulanus polymorphus]|uniref:solute carrier family 22 member 15-like n=1 Tax=Tubulanus polymorphus TaxID=672921 RepID=UPI003DA3D879
MVSSNESPDSANIFDATTSNHFENKADGYGSDDESKAESEVHFEQILDVLGHFGPFQIRVFSILTLMDLSTGQAMMLFVFSTISPLWSCAQFLDNSTLPNNTVKMCASENGSRCVRFQYDTTASMVSTVSEYDLVCDYDYQPQLSVSIQMIGVLFGAMLTGYIADWLGRKKTLLTMCTLMMATQIIVGFSISWPMYVVIRTFTGFFLGGTLNICFTLPMEFIGPKWRTFCGSFGLYGFGMATMSLMAYLTRDWRHVTYICGAMFTPIIPAVIFYVPESVRWLTMKGRFEEAEEIIRWMARVNKTGVPDMRLLRAIAAQDLNEQTEGKRHSYLDLFRTKELAIQTFVIMYCWYSCSSVAYGVSSMYSTFKGTVFLNSVISSAVSTPFAWSVIYVGNRFGRRRSFFAYMSLPCTCLLTVVIIGILGKKEELGVLVTVAALVGKGGAISCWILAAIYSAELYPTVMRSLGCAAASMAARIGGIIAPQLAYVGEVSHWVVPYVMYTFLAITTAIFVLIWLPETNKKPLKDAVLYHRANKNIEHGTKDDNDSGVSIVSTGDEKTNDEVDIGGTAFGSRPEIM